MTRSETSSAGIATTLVARCGNAVVRPSGRRVPSWPMLDIRRIRSEPDVVKAALARRGIDTADIDRVAELDERQRRLGSQRDELRAQIRATSKGGGLLDKEGKPQAAAAAQPESRELGEQEAALAAE